MNEEKKTMNLIEAAKAAESVEELMELAKESGVKLDEKKAQELYDSWHGTRELADEELDHVAGGTGCPGSDYIPKACEKCGGTLATVHCVVHEDVQYKCNACGHIMICYYPWDEVMRELEGAIG